MSPLELLAPEAPAHVPFSVRLAERRVAPRAVARSDRRAHLRRSATDLEWLSTVRLTGGTGCDVRLVDLSEGGALIEVDAPLRPGVSLTLELSGAGIDAAVPLEVLRCYITSLRGELAVYRGACAFGNLIEIPGRAVQQKTAAAAADFVGTEAALKYLLDRCASPSGLDRREVIHILDALHMRTRTAGSDVLSRHTSDLLGAILPGLQGKRSTNVVIAALEERMRSLPQRWQSLLQQTAGRLTLLVSFCEAHTNRTQASAPPEAPEPPSVASPPDVLAIAAAGQAKSGFQKIVARYTDGTILKGYTQDFHPSRQQFSLWPTINATPKERVPIAFGRLKAVFFVKDFNGNPGYRELKSTPAKTQGRRVEVTFADGEAITGTTLNYRPDGQGFFVSPMDAGANNTRIFVVGSALRRVRFL